MCRNFVLFLFKIRQKWFWFNYHLFFLFVFVFILLFFVCKIGWFYWALRLNWPMDIDLFDLNAINQMLGIRKTNRSHKNWYPMRNWRLSSWTAFSDKERQMCLVNHFRIVFSGAETKQNELRRTQTQPRVSIDPIKPSEDDREEKSG